MPPTEPSELACDAMAAFAALNGSAIWRTMNITENEIRLEGAEIPAWLHALMWEARGFKRLHERDVSCEREYKLVVERNLPMVLARHTHQREKWMGHGCLFDSSGFGLPLPEELWKQCEWVVAKMRAQREAMLVEWRTTFLQNDGDEGRRPAK